MLLRDLTLVPIDGPATDPVGEIRTADLRIAGDRIAAIGALTPAPGESTIDCGGLTAFPGFVQGHVHFCQTLFRGLADDLPLLEWLRQRIWPLEAAHDAASVRASAELSALELLRGGTTTVQVMESVRFAEESFAVAERFGLTAILGNCLMDVRSDDVPSSLPTTAGEALRLSDELCRNFHGRGRLAYAVSPRFVLSCSDRLAREAAAFANDRGLRIHTHASEHETEVRAVRESFGADYLEVLDRQGLVGDRTGLAHCVHLGPREVDVLVERGAAVLHCPTANLKLGSGIAPIARYASRSIPIALGADGAPCNNRLSALTEIRQAALLQAVAAEPGAFPASAALVAATRGGAAALGLDDVGQLAVGHRADLTLFDLGSPDLEPGGDPVQKLIYSAAERHIRHVLVGGEVAVLDGVCRTADPGAIRAEAVTQRDRVASRAGLAR